LFQTRQPCGVVSNRSDGFLEHELLRWGGTDALAAPAEGGGAPGGAARVTDIAPQEAGCEPQRRGREIVDGILTRPAQVPNGGILNRWDLDRSEVPRAHQAGQCEGVPPGGFDPLPGLFGAQRGGDAPADLAFLREGAGEPIAAWARVRDKDEGRTFGLQLPDEWIDVPLARPTVAKGDDLGVVCFGDRGHGHGLFMHISPDGECTRLVHG
jgi:hypothetical protein